MQARPHASYHERCPVALERRAPRRGLPVRCVLALALTSCGKTPRSGEHSDDGVVQPPDLSTSGSASSGTTRARNPVPSYDPPWPGWHHWPSGPADCAVFVPDDLERVRAPIQKACAFQANGCVAWEPGEDAGFSAAFSAARSDGAVHVSIARTIRDDWQEVVVLKGGALIAVWRSNYDKGFCQNSIPWFSPDGTAAMVTTRWNAESAPFVSIGSPAQLFAVPPRPELFGPPDAALMPNGVAALSGNLLVLSENYGRFTVRDLTSGKTYRPEPDARYATLEHPTPANGVVYYWLWTARLSSIWRFRPPDGHRSLLSANGYSFDGLAIDRHTIAYSRSSGPKSINEFENIELWVSPLDDADPDRLEPRKLADLPAGYLPRLSVGEGYVAAWLGVDDVRLYPLAGGRARRLPHVAGLGWLGGRHGLMLLDGAVWVLGLVPTGTNRVTTLARFELESLPFE